MKSNIVFGLLTVATIGINANLIYTQWMLTRTLGAFDLDLGAHAHPTRDCSVMDTKADRP